MGLQRDSLSPRAVRKSRAYPSLLEAMLLRGPREPKVPGGLGQQSTVVPELYGSLCLACLLCGDMWNHCQGLWSCATVRLSEVGQGGRGGQWEGHLTLSPTFSLEVRRYWEFGQRSI